MARTSSTSRLTAGTRTAAGNRFSIRDMGKCIDFNSQRINVPYDISLDAQNKFSFSFLVKPKGNTATNGRLFRYNINGWQFYISSAASQALTFNYGGTFTNIGYLKVQKWSLITVTFDESLSSNNFKLYFNDTLAAQYTQTSPLTSSPASDIRIATELNYNYFIGKMDEIRMWKNYVLSITEITDLMYAGIVPARDSLSLEYLFDDEAATATDSSGNGNDGTITGATYSTDVFIKPRTSV